MGYGHTVALKDDGTVWAWGSNEHGQLGDGSRADRSTPAQVEGIQAAARVAAGDVHTVVVTGDKTVWTWGDDSQGQLGLGTTIDRSAPTLVEFP